MTAFVKLASAPTADTPGTAIYLHAGKSAYVFGHITEGTQRAFNNNRISIGNTQNIFLSGSLRWKAIGGLFGYVLTVANSVDAAKEQTRQVNLERKAKGNKLIPFNVNESLGIHGGDNLCHSLAACRPVILRQAVHVTAHEQREDPRAKDGTNIDADWEDDTIQVWKVPVRRSRSSSPQKRRFGSPSDGDTATADIFKPLDGPSDPALARLVVETAMFSGQVKGQDPFLIRRKICDVKSSDLAFLHKNNNFSRYDGPFADLGAELPNPDETVWVYPGKDVVAHASDKSYLKSVPLPRTTYSELSMSYIVKCHSRRGKFNPAVAKSFGVKPTDFKLLTSGQSVQGENGVTVTPEMVLADPQPGHGFVVADIESRDFLDSFIERPEWSNTKLMEHIVAVYWILGPGMANDVRIKKFVQDHPKLKHIFSASDTCPNMISLSGPAELQTQLRCVDSDRFSLLKYDNAIRGPALEGNQVEHARAGSSIRLMPRLDLNSTEPMSFPDLLEAASSVNEEILAAAQKTQGETSDPEFLRRIEEDEADIPSRDAEIIPLGTGSSIPSKYRNVSATLIRVPGYGNYLLDCGEGTLGQIRRLFGDEETAAILRDMRCIAISHLHADHHLGTPSLIKAWYEATLENNEAKLAISCIWKYRTLLEEVSQVEDIGFHRLRFVNCSPEGDLSYVTAKDMGDEFGLASVKRIPVTHCWRSDALQLEIASGLRIAYSGDCRPSDNFARECRGAHLLVHECTFDDDMQSHAKKKQHSTMSEALGVARKMGARRTLLTHFSQRYVKSDSLNREGLDSGEVLMAFDHMQVRLGDFKKAAAFQPMIAKLLEENEK
ncbi:hypothetical protein B0T10DRAFT_526365 [Thelonectria olida]|uniref:ribonuclease Z n=1 Tax=Thelonectria olida TaxID=1576542 RepID=A0A9P9AUB9_9HYPO|nr:hypothetical protein B0T10DRAFT_526365 [Thelonectria olida]